MPKQYWDNGFNRLMNFYKSTAFSFVTELDLLGPDFETRMLLASRFVRTLHSDKKDTYEGKVLRPVHGENAKQRLEYFDEVLRRSKVRTTSVALGAVDIDLWWEQIETMRSQQAGTKSTDQRDSEVFIELHETAVGLAERGVKNLHLFGTSSNKAFQLLKELQAMNLFNQVSADSSTYAQTAFNNGKVWMFDRSAATLNEVTFSLKGKRPNDEELIPLRDCPCPSCTKPLFDDEDGMAFKVVDLGLSMLKENASALSLFSRKAQIHNACQLRLFVDHLNLPKSP
jgi:hypothetical protein